MRIRSWTTADGGCGFYRVRRPFRELSVHGHDTFIPNDAVPVPSVEDVLDTDVLVAQRVIHAELLPQWNHRRALRPVVFELDDDIWAIDPDNPALKDYLHPSVGDLAAEFVARSDLVTVSTAPLAERVSAWNPRVQVIPNCIDAAVLELPRADRTTDKITIGWSCSTSHVSDLRSVLGPWREFFGSRPDVELIIYGVDYRPMLALPDVRFEPWRPNIMDFYRGIDFDIAVAPLAPLIFNRSKSGNKAIEAFARGIPVVASNMEPYRGIVEDGVTGYLVDSAEQWAKRLGELADDADARAEMGANARRAAERHVIQGEDNWRRWESAYRSVLR
jgi:glycosyltransferase involved in cell wall biosynthesis